MPNDLDPELRAMQSLGLALEELDEDARGRVLAWAVQRYPSAQAPAIAQARATRSNPRMPVENGDFADLYGATDPRTDEERALVAAYWVTTNDHVQDMDSQTLNTMLKDLGYPVGNITRALGRLQKRRPALMRQVGKAGSSKQARKKYRMTVEGGRAVEEMQSGRHLGASAEMEE